MKKLLCMLLSILLVCSVAGCAKQTVSAEPSDYLLESDYHDGYRILQLTDIHVANKDNRQKQYDFMDLTIRDADADLIVLCGDLFTFADKATAKELFSFIDSYGIPWAVTFGNHDEQCYFPIDWLTSYLNNYGSNCLFKDIQQDDVFGYANYAINLTQNDELKYQIVIMDSNRYHYGYYFGYDYIKENQVAWYENIIRYTTEQNGGTVVPSVAFFHIPFPEFLTAWEEAQSGTNPDAVLEYGEKNENVSCPEYNSGLFDKMVELGSTKAVCVGHDHINNYRVKYKGIYLAYGVNSDDRIYYDPDLLGGMVVVLNEDGTQTFEYIYHAYEEVEES